MSKNSKYSPSLKLTAALSMLVAISIILGKYLAISVGDVLRFSFENLPVIFAGIAFGPLAAVLVAVTADLIGCLLVAYAINPLVTIGAAAVGLCAGLVPKILKRFFTIDQKWLVAATVAISHLLGSVVIKTFGLAVFYDMPIFVLMLWRLLNYVIVGTVEGFILYHIMKNKAIMLEIRKIMKGKDKK